MAKRIVKDQKGPKRPVWIKKENKGQMDQKGLKWVNSTRQTKLMSSVMLVRVFLSNGFVRRELCLPCFGRIRPSNDVAQSDFTAYRKCIVI